LSNIKTYFICECRFTQQEIKAILSTKKTLSHSLRAFLFIDMRYFISIVEMCQYLKFYLKYREVTDVIFLTFESPVWCSVPFPEKIKLSDAVSDFEKVISLRLCSKRNRNVIMLFLRKEIKKRNLSAAEIEVAFSLKKGKTVMEISRIRNVSVKTVYAQLTSIRNKLGMMGSDFKVAFSKY
jgi:DNA-binding CsgD family transcriptional regulator